MPKPFAQFQMQREDPRVQVTSSHSVIVDGNAGQSAIRGKTAHGRQADPSKENKSRGGVVTACQPFLFPELRADHVRLLHNFHDCSTIAASASVELRWIAGRRFSDVRSQTSWSTVMRAAAQPPQTHYCLRQAPLPTAIDVSGGAALLYLDCQRGFLPRTVKCLDRVSAPSPRV